MISHYKWICTQPNSDTMHEDDDMSSKMPGHFTHPLMGFAITGVATALGDPVMGATIATALFFGRESGQCKTCDQHSLSPYFRFDQWSRDNHLDFWPVLSVWAIPLAVHFLPLIQG